MKRDNPILDIYYDNPNEASDMYLKWLRKDCEKNGIEVRVFDNFKDWCEVKGGDGDLFLEPTKDMPTYLKCTEFNVDLDSATATGIYNYITENYPNRNTAIAVIGRGLVGKQLIDKLIDYGYTVCEFNSKSHPYDMLEFCVKIADVVVGLATEQIFNKNDCDDILYNGAIFIDASNNFDTEEKLRCGKWTRQVIIDRVLENYKKGLKDG